MPIRADLLGRIQTSRVLESSRSTRPSDLEHGDVATAVITLTVPALLRSFFEDCVHGRLQSCHGNVGFL